MNHRWNAFVYNKKRRRNKSSTSESSRSIAIQFTSIRNRTNVKIVIDISFKTLLSAIKNATKENMITNKVTTKNTIFTKNRIFECNWQTVSYLNRFVAQGSCHFDRLLTKSIQSHWICKHSWLLSCLSSCMHLHLYPFILWKCYDLLLDFGLPTNMDRCLRPNIKHFV